MEEGQVLKYVCKFCNKSFPCGRSLGGHMRSHLTNNSSEKLSNNRITKNGGTKLKPDQISSSSSQQFDAGYGLRDNPKKSFRFSGSDEECGKGFQSWKALFGQECDSDNQKMVLDSQSDNETTITPNNKKNKKKRRSHRRTRYIGTSNCSSFSVANTNNNNASSVSETEQEQEEVAMCLIMLSRDVNHWKSVAESSDNFSGAPKLPPSKKESENSASINAVSKEISDPEIFKNSNKRSKFECTTCNKTFQSYQALGGHRASHKKTKTCFSSNSIESFAHHNSPKAETKSNSSTKGHECPVCLKVFPSGQALGGHKRSHLINNGSELSKGVEIEKKAVVPEIRDFLDLNLPAPDEEESSKGNVTSLKPWWAESSHKHEALVI